MIEFAALIVVAFAILFVLLMTAIAAWGIWSKGYNGGYKAGLQVNIRSNGRTIYEPYKESLKPPREETP